MNNFTMYETILDILRKDKKGSITIEEFEKLLTFRSQWLFRSLLNKADVTKTFDKALKPFFVFNDFALPTGGQKKVLFSSLEETPAHIVSLSYVQGTSTIHTTDFDDVTPIDIVTMDEWNERLRNFVTKPTSDDPIAFIARDSIRFAGIGGDAVYIDYYKNPSDPYLDYYVNTNADYVYMTESSSRALVSGELGRDGETTGTLTSATVELEWDDNEKATLVEYVLTDLGVALDSQSIIQSSLAERQSTIVK